MHDDTFSRPDMNRLPRNKLNPLLSIRLLTVGLLFVLFSTSVFAQGQDRYSYQEYHMGTDFTITLYASDDSTAREAATHAFAEIDRLNEMMSDYLSESELNRLSRTSGSGKEVSVSPDLFVVLETAQWISYRTNGLFDVTIGPMSKAWRTLRRTPEPVMPGRKALKKLQDRVGYDQIVINHETQRVELLVPGMELDLGGIAKGYAAQKALEVLQNKGIRSALIDAGGDVTLGHPPPGRDRWRVAVPKKISREQTDVIHLDAAHKTVATSGDLFQFILIDGVRYSHILHPKTGLGATDQIQATVISSDGMTADAYASVLTLTDPEEGIRMIESLPDTEAIIFKRTDDEIIEWRSSGVSTYIAGGQ